MKNCQITKSELLDLFYASNKNANSLLNVALTNAFDENSGQISLGLAELALEELGKSFTCLSYYFQSNRDADWADFWKAWRNHTTKAYRAFLYEFFSLLRMELPQSEEYGITKRAKIPLEKEVSFYVDFDCKTKKILQPFIEIDKTEIVSRVTSVIGPLNTVTLIEELIKNNSSEIYLNAISKYAYMVMSNEIYQQDVEFLLPTLKNGVLENDKAIDDIWIMFSGQNELNRTAFTNLIIKK